MNNRPLSAEQSAYEFLLARILAGEVHGAIHQDTIAEELGMSRIPVRDAIKRLVSEGMVFFKSNGRAAVTALSVADVIELYEMRAALEGLAARHAAPNLTSMDLTELESGLALMDAARGNLTEWLEQHDAFHHLVASKAGMPRLARQLAQLRRTVRPFIRDFYQRYEDPELFMSPHKHLLDVLRQRNPTYAGAAFEAHIREALTVFENFATKQEKKRA